MAYVLNIGATLGSNVLGASKSKHLHFLPLATEQQPLPRVTSYAGLMHDTPGKAGSFLVEHASLDRCRTMHMA